MYLSSIPNVVIKFKFYRLTVSVSTCTTNYQDFGNFCGIPAQKFSSTHTTPNTPYVCECRNVHIEKKEEISESKIKLTMVISYWRRLEIEGGFV